MVIPDINFFMAHQSLIEYKIYPIVKLSICELYLPFALGEALVYEFYEEIFCEPLKS